MAWASRHLMWILCNLLHLSPSISIYLHLSQSLPSSSVLTIIMTINLSEVKALGSGMLGGLRISRVLRSTSWISCCSCRAAMEPSARTSLLWAPCLSVVQKGQIMWKSKMVNLSFRILTKYVGCMVHGGHAIVYVILCNSVQIDLNSVYLSNRVGWNGWRYLGGNLVPWKPKEGKSWGYQTEQCHRDTNWWSQPRQQ